MERLHNLIRKYDVPVPRYTSYPPVPMWDEKKFSELSWSDMVSRTFTETNNDKGISLYVHLPFCESLCTYCACNTRITKNHNVEMAYGDAVIHEWRLYQNLFYEKPNIRELHLGGGTPTFFSAYHLKELVEGILSFGKVPSHHEFSFEGHPNNTKLEQLRTLRELGFSRVSYGVQDLDEKVQTAIHRIQPFENLRRVVIWSRALGYSSISFDLVYGLPYQTAETIRETIQRVIDLRPDRISFYSYAHVPWIRPGQRGYEDADLPSDVVKRELYEIGRELFKEYGYKEVGMDHFALPGDTLYKAKEQGTIHRNFMGYTTTQTDLLIGLGASSISDSKYAYAQNEKGVEQYQDLVKSGMLPVVKGHCLTELDQKIRACILALSCQGWVSKSLIDDFSDNTQYQQLHMMRSEGIVSWNEDKLWITTEGLPFVRNICRVFDVRSSSMDNSIPSFSKAI